MTTLVEAIVNQSARTTNGMAARASTASATVDLFYGATRGANIVPQFVAAYVEDPETALRILQWIRDVRGGSGERQLFRDILLHMEQYYPHDALRLVSKIPEIGRWDDLLVFMTPELKQAAYSLIQSALVAGNGLAAKWMPRTGPLALELRAFMGLSPKAYRKLLVGLTRVVETPMCARQWESIDFSHVPSLAHARYKRAFQRNTPAYAAWVESLVKGEDGATINAGAVYPYDVLRGKIGVSSWDYEQEQSAPTDAAVIQAQWAALPNYIGDNSVLPMVDVSGSMTCQAGNRGTLSCLEVAVSLGLYFADKNRGVFKDTFLTFSGESQLVRLQGTVLEKIAQMTSSDWGTNTNLGGALDTLLRVAVEGGVSDADMPCTLVILSDMQFDVCTTNADHTAMQMIARKYEDAGYTLPRIVFWNLNARHGNVPVKFSDDGVALVSGFSPAIAAAVLSEGTEFTPESIMRRAVNIPRYDLPPRSTP